MTLSRRAQLLWFLLICQAAGVIGSFFTVQSVSTWYPTLNKPFFTPPDWLFAPVWITLYLMMGVSAFLIRQKGWTPQTKSALQVFFAQLIVNALWSGAFFGLRSPLAGLIAIILLWSLIAWTILKFSKISNPAALLLTPYLFWVSFAFLLNLSIVLLNR